MVFQIKQFMDEGSENPIVARLSIGLADLIQMTRLSEERREKVKSASFEIMCFLIDAEKAAKPLIGAIKQIEEKLNAEGVKTQQPSGAIETPTVMNLGSARTFLKFGKQALQSLAVAMGVLLEKDFNGPHFDKIAVRAKEAWRPDHPVAKLLEEDQRWIKEMLDLRNEDEHPKTSKPFVEDFDISPRPEGGYLIKVPRFYNDKGVRECLDACSHNLLTFSEEMIALGLTNFFPPGIILSEIPEDKRDPAKPVRFRLGLKNPPI